MYLQDYLWFLGAMLICMIFAGFANSKVHRTFAKYNNVSKLGMKVFLLTDCLINRENTDISLYPNGNFEDLTDFINSL